MATACTRYDSSRGVVSTGPRFLQGRAYAGAPSASVFRFGVHRLRVAMDGKCPCRRTANGTRTQSTDTTPPVYAKIKTNTDAPCPQRIFVRTYSLIAQCSMTWRPDSLRICPSGCERQSIAKRSLGIHANQAAADAGDSRQRLRCHGSRESVHGAAHRHVERIRLRADDFGLPLEQFDDCRQPIVG